MVKKWENGDELTLEIRDNQLVITSDPNEGLDREMEIDIITVNNNGKEAATAKLVIKQTGNALLFVTADNKQFITADNKIFTTKKPKE